MTMSDNEFFTPEQAQLYQEALDAGSGMSPLQFLEFLEEEGENKELIEEFQEAKSSGYLGDLDEYIEMIQKAG
jgi:hypothetical protein